MTTPYRLTLTKEERRAIEWIGHRYAHGDDLYHCLSNSDFGEHEWDDSGDITFHINEPTAWQICEIIEQDNLACFADSLKSKLYDFQSSVG